MTTPIRRRVRIQHQSGSTLLADLVAAESDAADTVTWDVDGTRPPYAVASPGADRIVLEVREALPRGVAIRVDLAGEPWRYVTDVAVVAPGVRRWRVTARRESRA